MLVLRALSKRNSRIAACVQGTFRRLNHIRGSDDARSEQQLYSHGEKVFFGDQVVTEANKLEKVYEVFRNVARSYDLMNDTMSGGLHRCWKDTLVSTLFPFPGIKHLDVASGTGDVALRIMNWLRNASKHGSGKGLAQPSQVVAFDFSDNMLKVCRERAKELGYAKAIDFVLGDAVQLPFADNTFDAYTVAFGIRNMVHIDKALEEAYRVLRVGGRFLCLEFSQVENPYVRWLYNQYSFQVIPVMGQVLARDWHSYQYLVESIGKFPDQETFKGMICDAGFCNVTYTNLTFGVVAIHSAFKL